MVTSPSPSRVISRPLATARSLSSKTIWRLDAPDRSSSSPSRRTDRRIANQRAKMASPRKKAAKETSSNSYQNPSHLQKNQVRDKSRILVPGACSPNPKRKPESSVLNKYLSRSMGTYSHSSDMASAPGVDILDNFRGLCVEDIHSHLGI